MNVTDVLEKIKSIDCDIKSIEWAREQINLRPADLSRRAWDALENELNKLEKEKNLIMEYLVEDNPPKARRGGDEG